jgi:uncharacterized protein (UPF0335 family)
MTQPNFWIKKRSHKTFTTGCTELHFASNWDLTNSRSNVISFNDEEIAELRAVLAVGSYPCGECPAAKDYMKYKPSDEMFNLKKRVDALDGGSEYTVHKLNHSAISDVLDSYRKRVQALENEVTHIKEDLSGHAGKHMKDNLVDKVGSLTINERQLRDRVERIEELLRRLFHYEG